MSKLEFKIFVQQLVDDFGVASYLDNITDDMTEEEINNDLWVTCPLCDEPLLYEDYADDENLLDGICPVCEENMYED